MSGSPRGLGPILRKRPLSSSGTRPVTCRSKAVTSLLRGAKFPEMYGAPVLCAEGIALAATFMFVSFATLKGISVLTVSCTIGELRARCRRQVAATIAIFRQGGDTFVQYSSP